jgi:transcriptional regulator with XRE-family HTH domain
VAWIGASPSANLTRMSTFDPKSRPSGGSALARWYSEALAEQRRRGISVSDFAGELGVSAVTLYQWRRRLAGGGSQKKPLPSGLIELKMDGATKVEQKPSGLRLHLDEHGVLEIPCDFDAEALSRLIEVLRAC